MIALGSPRLRCPFSDDHRQAHGQTPHSRQESCHYRDLGLHFRLMLRQNRYSDHWTDGEALYRSWLNYIS